MRTFKKLAALLSALLLVAITLSSCGEKPQGGETTPGGEATGLRVGYSRTDIMPDESMPLDSYGNAEKRYSTGYLNKIYFTAIAITDAEDHTLLLCTYDITQCNADVLSEIRGYASKTYGVDPSYVHLSGTHTHSSVALSLQTPEVTRYRAKLQKRAFEAIDEAMADRKNAEIYIAETKTEKMNFVRHYWREDGTSTGDNHGNWSSSPVVSHITDPDESMRILKFTRKEADGSAAKDVVICNWQAHNHLTGGAQKTDLAADFTGAMRENMEKDKDCLFAFFQGCAGNLNEEDNRLSENTRTKDYREYGKLLAEYAEGVYDEMTKVSAGTVKSVTKTFEAPVNHENDGLLEPATKIYQAWQANGNTTQAVADGKEFGIQSPYMANAIITNSKLATTMKVEVNAYCIGDIAFTSVPLEMFDVTGVEIRKASPFTFTITQGYTDGSFGYLPTSYAYEYGCYEADTTRFAKGAAEGVRDLLIEMLKELKN